jgi:hypothetical protein
VCGGGRDLLDDDAVGGGEGHGGPAT